MVEVTKQMPKLKKDEPKVETKVEHKAEPKASKTGEKIAAVLIRGREIGIRHDVVQALDILKLKRRHICVVYNDSPSIRGLGRSGYPALNVGGTAKTVEIYAFVPGLDPAKNDVTLERGVLSIAGERAAEPLPQDETATLHIDERFAGRFRRVVSLPDDVDPNGVSANYRDGVLHISIKRRESALPRRITIQ